MSDSGLAFSKLRARRGWGAHFNVTNTGTKPYQLDIGGLRSPLLKPGQKGRISASLDELGRYPFKVVGTTGAKKKGWFVVF